METTLYILLTIALVSRPTLCTPAPEEANSDEGREQTQIDQLYQIYKATQNNIIQLNTEVSLINDQLAELREKSASKSKVDGELSDLSSIIKSDFQQLLNDFQLLENEVVLNNSRRIDRVNSEVNAVSDSLQSSVSSLNTTNGATTTQLNSLQSSVSTLEGLLSGLGPGQVSAAINAIISLQSSVSSLTTRVNSPVNLYQNCIQETRSCTNTRSSSVYMKHCQTTTLPVNKSGYYTMSMSCKFDPIPHNYDTTALRQSGSNVQCLCWTTSLTSSGVHASASFRTFTCRLVITRCPTSQNIV